MVKGLCRGLGLRPIDPEGDAIYHAEVEMAKARRTEIQIRLGKRLRELAQVN